MIKINLLPVRAAKKKETLRQQISVAVMSLFLVLIALGYFHFRIVKDIAEATAKIAFTEGELQKTKSQIGEVSRFKEAKKVLEDKLGVIATLKKGKAGPVKMLDELSRVTPEKLWLVSFKEHGGGINIEGTAISNEVIAQFMTELEKSSSFKDIELVVTEQTEQAGLKLKKFSLTGKLEAL
ncbi:MAG: PilN domain-containing protein [Deltaproteobacteria bacterium]|nr:PilN domain-containing protein [Deltaproteobacteria bacterium]